jgi:hypothetical protein
MLSNCHAHATLRCCDALYVGRCRGSADAHGHVDAAMIVLLFAVMRCLLHAVCCALSRHTVMLPCGAMHCMLPAVLPVCCALFGNQVM